MNCTHYQRLDEELRSLAREMFCLSDAERSEVLHFVDVGEFGIALETAYAICLEEKRVATSANKSKMKSLAAEMGIGDVIEIDRLP